VTSEKVMVVAGNGNVKDKNVMKIFGPQKTHGKMKVLNPNIWVITYP